MHDDTIAAIATPIGEGGLAVIRVSGRQALSIADSCFLPVGKNSLKPPRHRAIRFISATWSATAVIVDEVLLSVMRAPRTFTREMSSRFRVMAVCCLPKRCWTHYSKMARDLPSRASSRAAHSLMAGFDLAQAEAVADLIHSRN